jgi:hypothetical protein
MLHISISRGGGEGKRRRKYILYIIYNVYLMIFLYRRLAEYL